MPRKKKEETPSSKAASKPKTKAAAKPKTVKTPKTAKSSKAKKETVSITTVVIKTKIPAARKTSAAKLAPVAATASSHVAASAFKPLARQGETQLIAFVRDPQCVFTYWEITPERLEEVKIELQDEFKNSHMVLRLYEIAANGDRHLVKEIRIEPGQINQYVDIEETGGTYQFEIAQKTESGKVVALVASRPVVTGWRLELNADVPTAQAVSNPNPNSTNPEMDPALQAYFEEQGFWESNESAIGISSMERRQRRQDQKAHWSSSF